MTIWRMRIACWTTKVTHALTHTHTHTPALTICNTHCFCAATMVIIYLFTAIGLSPGGSGYFKCKQNTKSVTTRFKSGGLHEKHVVATWNVGNHLNIYL